MSVVDHTLYVHYQEFCLNFSSSERLLTQLVEEDIHFVYKFWRDFRFFEPFLLCILVLFSCIMFIIIVLMEINYF